jgi:hypothetical protein
MKINFRAMEHLSNEAGDTKKNTMYIFKMKYTLTKLKQQ